MPERTPRSPARSSPAGLSSTSHRRCAIYTRKSSEEGLEQAFNSLDAQREACEAYIRSQKHEGWSRLAAHYDDGGLSGGTLERPALQQLLADIRAGKVDLIVVYKVDRLTRSLADFAKIVEILDAHGVSFVSVTQQFNTTTSMGRLTLNMLLSFAQFEREVTGERIRDKFAASRRKGMWMGGSVPLGYVVQDRKLVVEEAEAERVRHIYRRYAELGSVLSLRDHLAAEGILSKAGRPLSRGALFHLLQNRVYRGEVVHKGQVYPGEHAAILDQELWDGVQQRLAQNRRERGAGQRGRNPALLLGILYDASGDRLTPTHAVRRGVRYRYYVSHRLVVSGRKGAPDGRRIPASDLERLVTDTLLQYLADPVRLLALLGEAGAALSSISKQHQLIRAAKELAQAWPTLDPARQREFLHRLIGRVDVSDEAVTLQLDPGQLLNALNARGQAAATLTALPDDSGDGASTGHDRAPHTPASPPLILSVPSTLKRAGREMTLLLGDQDAPARQNPALIQLVVRAHAMRDALMASGDASLNEVAEREGMTKSYIARLVRLAYLAPGITQSILHGTQPSTITPSHLMRDTRLPIAWSEQERLLGAI